VLLDGERINACLTLAVQCEGAEITTIEGLEVDRLGSAVQEPFVTHDGLQCGYCTPGQICSVVAMLAEADASSPSAATHELAGPAIHPELGAGVATAVASHFEPSAPLSTVRPLCATNIG